MSARRSEMTNTEWAERIARAIHSGIQQVEPDEEVKAIHTTDVLVYTGEGGRYGFGLALEVDGTQRHFLVDVRAVHRDPDAEIEE